MASTTRGGMPGIRRTSPIMNWAAGRWTTEDTEYTESSFLGNGSSFRVLRVFRGRSGFFISADNAFDFDAGIVAEVDQQTDALASRFEVVVNLRPMFVSEFFHGF